METSEQELMRSSARHILETTKAAELPDALVDLGWIDLLDSDEVDAVTITAEEQGGKRVVSPILDLIMQHAAGIGPSATTAVVLPPIRRGAAVSGSRSAAGLDIDGVVGIGGEGAGTFLVLTAEGAVAVPASSCDRRPIAGADPELGLAFVNGTVAGSAVDTVAEAAGTHAAIDAGRRWLASELIGLADTMLADAVAYVLARHQFGRPIATFQAVKHRLADVHVGIAAARAGVATAWDDRSSLSAMAAKCLAGRAHALAATHCHQVQGGIAFTIEHGFHRWIRRGQLLDDLLGSSRDLAERIGEALISDRAVPRTPYL